MQLYQKRKKPLFAYTFLEMLPSEDSVNDPAQRELSKAGEPRGSYL